MPKKIFKKRVRLLHTGDLGDVVAALPILRALGGGELVFTDNRYMPLGKGPRQSMRGARFEAIKPLLERQRYVTKVTWEDDPKGITCDLSAFRMLPKLARNETLLEWQRRYVDITKGYSLEPWLEVNLHPTTEYIVVARSARYHNFFFNWQDLLWHFRDRDVVFVGFPDEHADLQKVAGIPIKYIRTDNLLQVAELIANATLTICNQSVPFWIAAGLGVPLLQESMEEVPDSLVPRSNAHYTVTGPETRTLLYRIEAIYETAKASKRGAFSESSPQTDEVGETAGSTPAPSITSLSPA